MNAPEIGSQLIFNGKKAVVVDVTALPGKPIIYKLFTANTEVPTRLLGRQVVGQFNDHMFTACWSRHREEFINALGDVIDVWKNDEEGIDYQAWLNAFDDAYSRE